MPPAMLRDGDRLNNRFRVQGDKPLGEGQFAQVYRALDESSGSGANPSAPPYVAIKIERESKMTPRELAALKNLQGCRGVPEVVASGTHPTRPNQPFIAMQLGGENLADIRLKRLAHRDCRHTLPTIGFIGTRVLDILRDIHSRGYVHRDVKPPNITLGAGSGDAASRALFLIDFGLAKQFAVDPAPNAPPREFRGSTTYASIHTHEGLEPGPRDDLWSLLYVLAECHEGTLPWRALKEERGNAAGEDGEALKADILAVKRRCREKPECLCPTMGTPAELIEFSACLSEVETTSGAPDYDRLRRLLERVGGGPDAARAPLDWERDGAASSGPGDATYADKLRGTTGNTTGGSKPSAPRAMTLARAVKVAKTSLPAEVTAAIRAVNENFDAEQSLAVGAGIFLAAIETNNTDDPYIAEHVEGILRDLVETGQEALEELARKRKR